MKRLVDIFLDHIINMPSAPSYYTLFVGVAVIMTHFRGAESFTLRRIASSASVGDSHGKSTATNRPERNSRQHTQLKASRTAEGDAVAGYEGGRQAHSDGHVPSGPFDLSDQVEAIVSIQIVKQDLPSADGMAVEPKDNNIHADLEFRPREIHYNLSSVNQVPLGQQWSLIKQFILSDYYFGKLDELAKEYFLQKMLKSLIISQSQKI